MHRKSESNERARAPARIRRLRSSKSRPARRGGSPGTIDTSISAEFSSAYRGSRRNSRDICLPISFFLLPFEAHARTPSAFPTSLYFLTRPFLSFIRPYLRQEQFRLFEQRREYYSADYARLFRLENPLCDFRRAAQAALHLPVVFLPKI